MRYLEDIPIGVEEAGLGEYEVTAEEIMEVGRRWDPQPFHVDEASAAATLYGGLVASSVHLFAIFAALGSRRANPTAAMAGLGFDEVRVLQPARPGDRLRSFSMCIDKRNSKTKPDRGIARFRSRLENQRGENVFEVTTLVMVARRPADAP